MRYECIKKAFNKNRKLLNKLLVIDKNKLFCLVLPVTLLLILALQVFLLTFKIIDVNITDEAII